MTIQQLQDWVSESWGSNDKHSPTVETQVLYIIEELGEVAEAIRKNKGLKDRKTSSVDLDSEFGDLLISIITLANTYNVDVTKQIKAFQACLASRSA